ncbi:MAG TPA: MOSC N-terminal beta barrel domain-containing protein [Capsulimonadaceae bacterium]|nr:MOSC N-terminal beta barrel domain-containing protein [Capsulimonadaceae bacterium]
MPYLAKISIHPIKSLDSVSVSSARIGEGGGLEHDRELAIFDAEGNYVNGKRNEKVHFLSPCVDWKAGSLRIGKRDGPPACFHLDTEIEEINAWLSAYFEKPVFLKRNSRGGFPDDKKATGPTVIGACTIDEVASWYSGLIHEEVGARFRANLEIGDAPAFWEDRLYAGLDEAIAFRIGDVVLHGMKPCQRCVVPTRDTKSSEPYPEFANIFRARREELLPDWADISRFDHFYRLAVNTNVPDSEIGKALRVGDEVVIL